MPVVIKGFKQLSDKIQTFLKNDIQATALYTQIAEYSKDKIYARTKSGKTADASQNIVSNKPLSESYVKYRKKFASIHPTGALFSPKRSNLTLTGQLLDSLTYKIDTRRKSVTVTVNDETRAPVPQISLRNLKKEPADKTNKEVAKELADKGRPFLVFDKQMVARIKSLVRDFLRTKIKDSFG